MTQPFTWAPVQKGQVVDADQTNSLGNRVVAHDVSITALVAVSMAFKARQILSAPAASVTFTSIPTNLRRLCLSTTTRSDAAAQQQVYLNIQINSDPTAVYDFAYNQTAGTVSSGATFAAQTAGIGGFTAGPSAQANFWSPNEITITGWDSPHGAGGLAWTYTGGVFGSTTGNYTTLQGIARYAAAGPYTSIRFFPGAGSFIAGCDFQLEGWA